MAPSTYLHDVPIIPKLCLGPGDSFCADYEDPRRLLGSNLPSGLKKIIADRLTGNSDSDWDSELDVSDESSSSGNESSTAPDSCVSSRRRPQEPSRSRARGEIVREKDTRDYDDYRYDYRKRRVKDPFRISCLAFGSRIGDFAMISSENREHFLDGNVFQRLDTLRRWLVPQVAWNQSVDHTPIKGRNGADIRLFLGAESTYFAVDTRTREYVTNIDSADFGDWILECIDPFDTRASKTPILRKNYVPHCLVFGPDDMFCWISQKAFKVNNAFRSAFPSIERFLKFCKAKKILNKVTFVASTETQPDSKLPYYVLSTADGVCVSSVPASAADIISKYSTRWGAVRSAKQAREIKNLQSSAFSANNAYHNLTWPLQEAWNLIQGGADYGTRLETDRAILIVTDLKRIEDDCRRNALGDPDWVQASLADRVQMLLRTRTLDGYTLQEWEKLATKLAKEIRVAEKTIAGGTKGHVPDDSSSDPEVIDMIKYVVHEVEIINQMCESNKVEGSDWESLSLSGKVAAIAANQQTPEMQQKIRDGIWVLNSHYGIPQDITSDQQMVMIIQGLETINKDVNNVPFANDEWRAIPLVDRVNTIVAQRLVQESDKPSRELLDLLMDAIYDLIPAKGIRTDPTGLEYMATIMKELQSIDQVVNSTVDEKLTEEFSKWRIQTLAERVKSVTTDFITSRDKSIAAMLRLGIELEDIPPGPSRDRIIALLQTVFPDEDIVDPKKEEKKTEYPIYDPDAGKRISDDGLNT